MRDRMIETVVIPNVGEFPVFLSDELPQSIVLLVGDASIAVVHSGKVLGVLSLCESQWAWQPLEEAS